MILVVGATSKLGRQVIPLLLSQGEQIRAMTRTPGSPEAEILKTHGAEVVAGDLRDPASLVRACTGAEKVLTAAHAFLGAGDNNLRTVDDGGNRSLIDTAKDAGVQHFVFISIQGTRPDHPLEFFRIKYGIEEYLHSSGLSYTILRPTAFMEFWAALIGQPILEKGQTTIFGRGVNPVNFVSVADVAGFAVIALKNPQARRQIIEIGGPENLSLRQVAEIFERIAGRPASKRYIPLPVMRVMSVLARPFNPALSQQIAAGVYMDTADQTLDMTETLRRFPLPLRRLEEVVQQQYIGAADIGSHKG